MNTRSIGKEYEDKACAFLEKEGMRIIERNYAVKFGEIDIIAREADELVFVEVKYRKNRNCGGAEYAITKAKQNRIRKTAQCYMISKGCKPSAFCRFDAVLIDGEEIKHIRKAWI